MRSFKATAAATKEVFFGLLLLSLLLLPTGCGSSDPKVPALDGDTNDSETSVDGDTEVEKEAEAVKPATLFKVGYGEADFTPPNGTVMGAYGTPGGGRKTESVHDQLRGQLMLFTNDAGQAFILIAMDLAGYFFEYGDWNDPKTADGEAPAVREIRKNIVEALKGKLDLQPEHIVMSSSHSHASPDMIGFFQASNKGPDKALARSYRDKLVQAAKDAAAGLVEADVYFGKTEIVGLTGDSSGCFGGKIDNSVNIIQAKKKDGTVIFTAANYAVHPTTQGAGNREASADMVWGYREEMEKTIAGKAVFLQGTQAAIHWGPMSVGGDGWEHTYAVGKVLSDAVIAALPNLTKATEFDILHKSGTTSCMANGSLLMLAENYFKVPKRSVTPIYADGDEDIFETDDASVKAVQPIAYKIEVIEVSWHKLGPAEFQTFPGEATPWLGMTAKEHMISPNKFALGLANDSLGYIIDEYSRVNDPSIHAGGDEDDPGQLAGYELGMGMGAPGGPCIWEAIQKLGWFDGKFKESK